MPLRLTAVLGDQTIELRPGTSLVVGRAASSDAAVVDSTVSRRHAELVVGESTAEVRDLGSSNGTFVNDVRVERGQITAGDVVRFGKVAFRVLEALALTDTFAARPDARTGPADDTRTVPTDVRSGSPTTPLEPAGAASGVARTVIRSALDAVGSGTRIGSVAAPADRRELRLRTLLEVSKQLTQAASLDVLLDKIVDVCFRTFDVDRVALVLGETADDLVPKIARDRRGRALEGMVPLSIARNAVAERAGILTDDAPADERFGGQSVLVQQVRSALCAPLLGSEGRVLGVLYVDNQALTHRFDEEDLEFVIAFAGIAGVAIENGEFAERIRREALVRSNFERFFSPGIAERIAATPEGASALAGDRRPVAVLFTDVRGFTPLAESLPPEIIATLLTDYFTELAECVFRHGGTLDKFLGDGLMALWGAPIAGPDDADRALRSAMEMMDALDALNGRLEIEGGPRLETGIGINYGEAFAGTIGSARRLEYTVIGDVVNTASRLCASAEGGEILVSESLREALSPALRSATALRAHAALELRGKRHPVPVFAVAR